MSLSRFICAAISCFCYNYAEELITGNKNYKRALDRTESQVIVFIIFLFSGGVK